MTRRCPPVLVLLPLLLPLLVAACSHSADDPGDDSTGHLRPFGAQGPVTEIDAVNGFISPEEFLKKYVMKNKPLLFKEAAKASPAFEKWTDAFLDQNTPPRPEGDVQIEYGKKENRSQKYGYLHFKEFLSIYNSSNIYMVSSLPSNLLSDLVVPFPLQCRHFVNGGLDTHVAWFSSGGTSSVVHHDEYENINCLLRGSKKLVFVNINRYRTKVGRMIDNTERGFSTVDVDRIDIKSRPEFAGLEFQSVEMHAGDCLYIPNLWVHQVRSFDNNLAVNLWWNNQPTYDASGCATKFDPNLRFSRVHFGSQLRTARTDADSVRGILASHLNLPDTEAALLSLLCSGDPTGVSTNWPQFPAAVTALFSSLDINQDKMLTVDELEEKMKFKAAIRLRKAIMTYNVQVFAMHESAESAGTDVGRLPKLLEIDGSDESVFAQHRTWQMVGGASGSDAEPTPSDDGEATESKEEL